MLITIILIKQLPVILVATGLCCSGIAPLVWAARRPNR